MGDDTQSPGAPTGVRRDASTASAPARPHAASSWWTSEGFLPTGSEGSSEGLTVSVCIGGRKGIDTPPPWGAWMLCRVVEIRRCCLAAPSEPSKTFGGSYVRLLRPSAIREVPVGPCGRSTRIVCIVDETAEADVAAEIGPSPESADDKSDGREVESLRGQNAWYEGTSLAFRPGRMGVRSIVSFTG